MIKSVEIKNFKSIKGKYFGLRNLNVLLGLNGMGKSSFIQCLLGLRQSQSQRYGTFSLNGEYVKLGDSRDVLYQYAKDRTMAINIVFSNSKSLKLNYQYEINADRLSIIEDNNSYNAERDYFEEITPTISLFNHSFQYLQANRHDPSTINPKSKSIVVEKRNIGNRGEYAAHYIDLFSGENIIAEQLLHKHSISEDTLTGEKLIVKSLIKQLELWMGEISPDVNISTTEISSDQVKLEYSYKQRNLGNTNKFKPENVGFGITYGLPVVLSLLKAKPGDLIIIENPESHIHPRGQAELGKMMALAAQNGVQIIVETHSDHIVNGIRVAVKEKSIDIDNVILFYFDKILKPDEQYSNIINVEIDENGELSEYPKNMLDEWSNQLLNLI